MVSADLKRQGLSSDTLVRLGVVLDPLLLEQRELEDWQPQFLEMAHMLGYEHNFTRRTRGKGGAWTTSTSMKGWPDLYLWSQHRRRSMFVEMKTETGKVSPDQEACLISLATAGIECHVWRPRHLQIAQQTLTRRTNQ